MPHTLCHTNSPGASTGSEVLGLPDWNPACVGSGAECVWGARVCSEATGGEIEVFKDTWLAQEHAEGVRAVILPWAEEGLWGATRGRSVQGLLRMLC